MVFPTLRHIWGPSDTKALVKELASEPNRFIEARPTRPFEIPPEIDSATNLEDAYGEFPFEQFLEQRDDIRAVARRHARFVRHHDHGTYFFD